MSGRRLGGPTRRWPAAVGARRPAGPRARRLAAVAGAAVVLGLGGCGGGGAAGGGASGGQAAAGRPALVVSAAASLRRAFSDYAARFPGASVHLSFGGSDALAAQIRRGVRPDVFASANTTLPDALFASHLVARPTVFAANRLVVAVPAGSTKVGSVGDLARPGTTLAVGSPSVPVGAYTRTVIARLGPAESARILANVRSSEPDVAGIVGKLTQGAVDAGFVYITDVDATHGRLRAIELPPRLRPRVAYAAAVVEGAPHPREARAFVRRLLSGPGARALRASRFEPPPR